MGKGTGDRAPDLLLGMLGAEIIAIGPVDSPLPVTGHCSRCGLSTTRYGPAGRLVCDRCRASRASRPAKPADDAGSA